MAYIRAVERPRSFFPDLRASCTVGLHRLTLSSVLALFTEISRHAPSRAPETSSASQYPLELVSNSQRRFGGREEEPSTPRCSFSSKFCAESPSTSL